jgi:hypothetical protein
VIRPIYSLLLAFSLALSLVLATSPSAQSNTTYVEGTDSASVMFNPLKVLNMDFDLPQSSIDNLWIDPETYQPATLTYTKPDGSRVGPFNITFRLKGGWGSWRDLNAKAAFKIKIPSAARSNIYGLKKLTLNNMVQDPSFLHEALAYRLFRNVGIAAPRVGYSWVTLNGTTYGLYANVETPDDLMLGRWFESTQHLYEGAYWADLWPGYESYFEVDEGDEDDRSDLTNLINVNQLEGEAWFNAIQDVADLNQFVTMWAVETYIGHWDGYSYVIKNNYYLHSDDTGKFSMLPWGTDQTWDAYLPYHDTYDRALMFYRCISYLPCRGLYDQAITRVVSSAKSLRLTVMLNRIKLVVNPYVDLDPRKEVSSVDSVYWQGSARTFISNRTKETEALVKTFQTAAPKLKGGIRGSQVSLSWNAVSNPIYSTLRYEIEAVSATGIQVFTTTNTSILIARPVGAVKFRVRAVTHYGMGPWSNTLSLKR